MFMVAHMVRCPNQRERHAVSTTATRREGLALHASYFMFFRMVAVMINLVDSGCFTDVSRLQSHNAFSPFFENLAGRACMSAQASSLRPAAANVKLKRSSIADP